MEEREIDVKGLDGLLSRDALRFLMRAKEYFRVKDIVFPAHHNYSLSHVLRSLASLTEHQVAVFELLDQSKKFPAFMPVEAKDIIGWGGGLGLLASEKDRVAELFERLGELGYDRFQFMRGEGREVDQEYPGYQFNVTLDAAGGIVRLAKEADATILTLDRLKKKYGSLLPLYSSHKGNLNDPSDGIFFASKNFIKLTKNLEDVLTAIQRLGIINTKNMQGNHGSSLHDVYRYPAEIRQLGQHADEVANLMKLTTGKNSVDSNCRGLNWYAPVILGSIGDAPLTKLLEDLQPYAVGKDRPAGLVLAMDHASLGEKGNLACVKVAKVLARTRHDQVIELARAISDSKSVMYLSQLASDQKYAGVLLDQSAGLLAFVSEISRYRVYDKHDQVGNDLEKYRDKQRPLKTYAELVKSCLVGKQVILDAVSQLHSQHNLGFSCFGLHDVLEAGIELHKALKGRSLEVDKIVGDLDATKGAYYLSNIPRAVNHPRYFVNSQPHQPQIPPKRERFSVLPD